VDVRIQAVAQGTAPTNRQNLMCLCLRSLFVVVTMASAIAADTGPLRISGRWPGFRQGRATALGVSGSHAYVEMVGSGLLIFDITDPTEPTRVGGFAAGWDSPRLVFADKYWYIATGV
jgi:hypothetical protein